MLLQEQINHFVVRVAFGRRGESVFGVLIMHISGGDHPGFKCKRDTLNANTLGFFCNKHCSLLKFLFMI